MFEEWKRIVKNICIRALTGKISIEEFYAIWPENLHQSEFVLQIYSDLEESIQHFPAKFFSGEPDKESWISSDFYRNLFIDSEILNLNNSEKELKEIRETIIDKKYIPLNQIPAAIDNLKLRLN